MQFERLAGISPEVLRLLNQHPSLAYYALVVFGHSRYLGETLIHNSDLLHSFLRERNLDRSFSREEFHEGLARFLSRSFETDVSLLLAQFKRREYVRIMLRDVLRIAPLAETTAEISSLSDVLIEHALREAYSRLLRRYRAPQHGDPEGRLVDTAFAILSLGKLGGSELNYSSDVDLMYIFGDGEAPAGTPISNREYFIRLAQQVTEILSCATREGPVFRIDLRLRPQGGEGELAISLSHGLHYYAAVAHDWERQALIKVRCSAGDSTLAREFIRGVQPHVYTEQVNFAAIKTALVARERMHSRRLRHAAVSSADGCDVKVGRGGIRDIEFLVQCLQRVYGGAEPWLRSGGTLFSLQKLHDKRHVSGKEFHDLTSAYVFLRQIEHRLQLRQGHQTHRLPGDPTELGILQRSVEGDVPGETRVPDLVALVRRRMAAVAEIYQRVIFQQQNRRRHEVSDTPFELRGASEPGAVDLSNQQIMERLAADAPEIHQAAVRSDLDPQARKNLLRFLSSAFMNSVRYAAVVEHPQAVIQALPLFESSDYLSDILIHNPEEIATVANLLEAEPHAAREHLLFQTVDSPKAGMLDPVFLYIARATLPYGEKLALLRQQFRHHAFVEGARDIRTLRNVYESLAATSGAADDALGAALALAGNPKDLAVMALGRLGGRELDLLSDVDVVFICEEGDDRLQLTRAAEQMTQALDAYTRDGMVFPVDARLRPRGGEGELLVSPTQLASYFENEAQAWEALSYAKMRYVAGSRSLAERAISATDKLFQRFGEDSGFRGGVREMRAKLDAADAPEKSFKTSAGAIYDIDFLTGFLLIKHGVAEKGGNLRDRLWRCVAAGRLDKADAAVLDHAGELLRTVDHVVRLVIGRTSRWLPATEHARRATEKLTAGILGRSFCEGLEVELLDNCAAVRQIFQRIC